MPEIKLVLFLLFMAMCCFYVVMFFAQSNLMILRDGENGFECMRYDFKNSTKLSRIKSSLFLFLLGPLAFFILIIKDDVLHKWFGIEVTKF